MAYYSTFMPTQLQSIDDIKSYNIGLSDIEIDAELEWVSEYGRFLVDHQDYGRSMTMDGDNNIYIVGDSYIVGSDRDIFVAKFNSSGSHQWNVTWSTNIRDYGEDIALDSEGNIFVAGYSRVLSQPNMNITLIKFDNAGTELWNRTWGAGGYTTYDTDKGNSIVIDSNDNIFVIGSGWVNSSTNVVILKYNQTGDLLSYAYWNGPDDHHAEGISAFIDNDNDIYITGNYKESSLVKYDIFLLKFNSSENFEFYRIWGGIESDFGFNIALDSKGNIYVVGHTYSIGVGASDMCLLKYDKYGNFIYVRTWGWQKSDGCVGIVFDQFDNIYIAGVSSFLYDPHTVSPFDIVLVKYNKYGVYQWNTTWGEHLDGDSTKSIYFNNNNLYILAVKHPISISNAEITLLLKYNLPSAPNITINNPNQDETYGTLAPAFNVSIYVSNFNKSWYTLNNGVTKYYFTGTLGSIDQTAWNLITDGPVSIQFHVSDNYNNSASNEVIVYKDTNSPVITIISPSDFKVFGSNSPSFEVSISDTNLNRTWYSLNSEPEKFFFSGSIGQIEQSLWEELIDGLHTLKFCANDTLGYTSNKEVSIYKDTTVPSILITSPVPDELFGKSSPNFSLVLNEPNINSSWYTLNEGSTNYFFTGSNGAIDQDAWNSCLNGTVLIKFYVNDTFGLVSNSSVVIRKDIESPSIIFEFNEFYLNTTHPEYSDKMLSVICNAFDSSGISWVSLCENTQGFYENQTMISMGDGNWSYNIDISNLNWNDEFSIFFYVNDLAGNTLSDDNSSSLYNLKIYDFIKPNSMISFIPHSGIININTTTRFSIFSDDRFGSGIYQIHYKINNSNWINYNNPFTLSTFSSGYYNITYYSIDLAGNIEGTKSLIVKLIEIEIREPPPSTISGYSLFSLMGVILLALIIIERKTTQK
jgi:uncharacterized delta-60 repeat protein